MRKMTSSSARNSFRRHESSPIDDHDVLHEKPKADLMSRGDGGGVRSHGDSHETYHHQKRGKGHMKTRRKMRYTKAFCTK